MATMPILAQAGACAADSRELCHSHARYKQARPLAWVNKCAHASALPMRLCRHSLTLGVASMDQRDLVHEPEVLHRCVSEGELCLLAPC